MKQRKSGGGWQAIDYVFRKAFASGGLWKMYRALRSKNACKTCAVGMGGQKGGMVNELGRFPEVCKKSVQAMAADLQGAVPEGFFKTYSIPQLRRFTPFELEHAGRLTRPLLAVAGEQHYQPIEWDDAIGRIVAQLKSIGADESFFYFSGRSSNEAGFLLQLFARLYGTNNVNNCSYYCHQASGVGLTSATGSGTATITLEDVDGADCVFMIGGNPPSNHPRLMRTLMEVRRRGGQVIVINPVVETGLVNFKVPSDVRSLLFGSEIASLYVQPHIGGDLALLYGVAKAIVEAGAHDEVFLNEHTNGWPEWRQQLADLSWEEIERKSGVAQPEVRKIAECYARARNAVFSWTMGITHHENGVDNVQAIANLALLRGMVGRPNAGLMPIRGHSNVQGIGSVGVTPKLKEAIFDRLQTHFGVQLPTTVGKDTMACMEASATGELKAGLCLGGNLYGSNPDSQFASEAISKLRQIVYLSTTLNTGHAHGLAEETIILPVLARDEEPQPTTQESMFNYVRLSDGGPARLQGPRSEVSVIASIARGVLGDGGAVDWSSMEDCGKIRQAIAKVVPGFDAIAEIDKTKKEFQIDGRTFHEPKFATENGRANIHTHHLPELSGGPGEFRLMTVRSEGQFNTVVYEEYDLYRGQEHRNVILLHPDDVVRSGFTDDDLVDVISETGRLNGVRIREWNKIRAGNALMYYPEANVLVSRKLDPRSRTPAYKNVLVRLVSHEASTSRESAAVGA